MENPTVPFDLTDKLLIMLIAGW